MTEVCASAQAHARRRAPGARAGAGGRGRAHSVSASRPQVSSTRIMTSFLGFHSRPVAGMRQRTSVPNTTYVPNAARARALPGRRGARDGLAARCAMHRRRLRGRWHPEHVTHTPGRLDFELSYARRASYIGARQHSRPWLEPAWA